MIFKRNLIATSFLALATVIFAQPPSSYGPPGFSSPGVISSSGSSGGGSSASRVSITSSGSSGGSFSGGEGGAPEPFSYAYEVKDSPSGNDFASQADSDGKRVTGEYRVLLPDGRRQIVKYTADDSGYNANVVYEGQARYPVPVAKASSGGSTIVASGGSSGGSTIIASSGSSGGSGGSFAGYRY